MGTRYLQANSRWGCREWGGVRGGSHLAGSQALGDPPALKMKTTCLRPFGEQMSHVLFSPAPSPGALPRILHGSGHLMSGGRDLPAREHDYKERSERYFWSVWKFSYLKAVLNVLCLSTHQRARCACDVAKEGDRPEALPETLLAERAVASHAAPRPGRQACPAPHRCSVLDEGLASFLRRTPQLASFCPPVIFLQVPHLGNDLCFSVI